MLQCQCHRITRLLILLILLLIHDIFPTKFVIAGGIGGNSENELKKRKHVKHALSQNPREKLQTILTQKTNTAEDILTDNPTNSGKGSSESFNQPSGTSDYNAGSKKINADRSTSAAPAGLEARNEQHKAQLSEVSPQKDDQDTSTSSSVNSRNPIPTADNCLPCPYKNASAAGISKFWENDMKGANGCSCVALQDKKDDNIALSVYIATAKYMQGVSGVEYAHLDSNILTKASPSVVGHWEVLAPFPCGQMAVNAGQTTL